MRSLQLLSALLLLVVCLQLGTFAQEYSWNVLTMEAELPEEANANEEVPLVLRVMTDLKECMVVKTYIKSSKELEGSSHNYAFTSCLCDDYPRTFFWDIRSNSTVAFWAVVDIVPELNICPENRAVMPITVKHFEMPLVLNITSEN